MKKNEERERGAFAIFGYSSKKQITYIDIDLYKYNQGFILELNNYFSIDNNLFGYELDIKISSIPNKLKGIKFFSINENKEIKINDIINVNDSIIFDISEANIQIGEKYIIEITSIISTPEYNKFIQFYDKRDEYGENFEKYYQDMYDINSIGNTIFICLVLLYYLFKIFPLIYSENKDINKTRTILSVIPKNVIYEIIKNENIKEEKENENN